MRWLVFKSIFAEKDRNSPLSANQGLSTVEPRHVHGHAVCTIRGQPPRTSALLAVLSPSSPRFN